MEKVIAKMSRIFIVDDEQDVRILYEKMLRLKGFDVFPSAKTGKEAIKMFNNFNPKPDIILMDCLMPGINGLEAMREILKLNYGTKIIMISSDATVKQEALKVGAKKFLDKTVSMVELLKALKDVLNE